MESRSTVPQALPPQVIVMQMVMGGWIARAVSDLSRLNIPDALKINGRYPQPSWSPAAWMRTRMPWSA